MASTITLIWNESLPATVTINRSSGQAAVFDIAGTPVVFPYTMTSTTTFSTAQQDSFVLSVQCQGREIASKTDTTLTVPVTDDKQGVVLAPGPDSLFPNYGFRSAANGTQVGFYAATPVPKAAAPTVSAAAAPAGGIGAAAGAYDTAANRDALIALVNNNRTRLIEIETALRNLGLIS